MRFDLWSLSTMLSVYDEVRGLWLLFDYFFLILFKHFSLGFQFRSMKTIVLLKNLSKSPKSISHTMMMMHEIWRFPNWEEFWQQNWRTIKTILIMKNTTLGTYKVQVHKGKKCLRNGQWLSKRIVCVWMKILQPV